MLVEIVEVVQLFYWFDGGSVNVIQLLQRFLNSLLKTCIFGRKKFSIIAK